MKPPMVSVAGKRADVAEKPSAVSLSLTVIRKRADFIKASYAKRQVMPGFVLQARERSSDETHVGIRIGYTCSKKVGNAVARNRAKRRLREIAQHIIPQFGLQGWDYVLVGRAAKTASLPFDLLENDLRKALQIIHPEK